MKERHDDDEANERFDDGLCFAEAGLAALCRLADFGRGDAKPGASVAARRRETNVGRSAHDASALRTTEVISF